MSKEEILMREITALSEASSWEEAVKEWKLQSIHFAPSPQTCLCTHFPILEICTIENYLNQRSVDVGNCCVKKFIGLPSDKLFQAVKRVKKDVTKSLNQETLDYALEKGWITAWEHRFYRDTLRKRKLSDKQIEKRKQINETVSKQISKPPTPKPIKRKHKEGSS